MQYASPLSLSVIHEQIQSVNQTQSIEELFEVEMFLSKRCLQTDPEEFREGIRALLIDKDRQPNWKYSSLNEIPQN